MIVSRQMFDEAIHTLSESPEIAVDTETTGLEVHHGDCLFSIIMANATREFYFNFNEYPNMPEDLKLCDRHLETLWHLFNLDKTWYFHNAKFDWGMLRNEGLPKIGGLIHDTKVVERILYNDLPPGSYDLDSCAQRRGYKKDDTVRKFINDNKLYEYKWREGKKFKRLRYDLVPLDIIVPYGCRDSRITFDLARHQLHELKNRVKETPAEWPSLRRVYDNENELLRNVFEMEWTGVRIDEEFCREGIQKCINEREAKEATFKELTGHEFKKSGKLFQQIFAGEKDKWGWTNPRKNKSGTSNPSFDKENVLPHLEHPAAKIIIDIAKAKSNQDYYQGFLFHADKAGIIHTNFNQDGTDTGRFSSSNPNLQNLKKVDEDTQEDEFHVRKAIIPRPRRFFVMMDYDQLQYRMMLDYAGAMDIIDKIIGGLDVHQATADIAGIGRYEAKTTNFSILFGAGLELLSKNLGVSTLKAREIKDSIFRAAPEIHNFVRAAMSKAEKRGYVFNWFGRRYDFPNIKMSYMAPNKIIQGGEADLVKVAKNRCAKYLRGMQTSIVLTIHDEIVFEGVDSEAWVLPELKEIMEGVYPSRYLPMTVGVSHSYKSLADKIKGYPPCLPGTEDVKGKPGA